MLPMPPNTSPNPETIGPVADFTLPAIDDRPDTRPLSDTLENTPENPPPTLAPSVLMFESRELVILPNSTPSPLAMPETDRPMSVDASFAPSCLEWAGESFAALLDAVDRVRERVAVHGERGAQVLVEIRFELLQAGQS